MRIRVGLVGMAVFSVASIATSVYYVQVDSSWFKAVLAVVMGLAGLAFVATGWWIVRAHDRIMKAKPES